MQQGIRQIPDSRILARVVGLVDKGDYLSALFPVFADSLGIGPVPGYGWKQIAAMVVGAIVTLAGIWLTLRKGA